MVPLELLEHGSTSSKRVVSDISMGSRLRDRREGCSAARPADRRVPRRWAYTEAALTYRCMVASWATEEPAGPLARATEQWVAEGLLQGG